MNGLIVPVAIYDNPAFKLSMSSLSMSVVVMLKTKAPELFSLTRTSKNCSIPPSKPGLQESRKCSAEGLIVVQFATGSGATAIKHILCNTYFVKIEAIF